MSEGPNFRAGSPEIVAKLARKSAMASVPNKTHFTKWVTKYVAAQILSQLHRETFAGAFILNVFEADGVEYKSPSEAFKDL